MNDKLKNLKKEAEKALTCLYIAVESSIADDLNRKVKAYIQALEQQCFEQMGVPKELTEPEKAKGRSSTYWDMSPEEQWAEDKRNGILDWDGN